MYRDVNRDGLAAGDSANEARPIPLIVGPRRRAAFRPKGLELIGLARNRTPSAGSERLCRVGLQSMIRAMVGC